MCFPFGFVDICDICKQFLARFAFGANLFFVQLYFLLNIMCQELGVRRTLGAVVDTMTASDVVRVRSGVLAHRRR